MNGNEPELLLGRWEGAVADVRHERSEKAIKDAFVRLSGRVGADHVSMTMLASEAKVSRSTLYAHFRNVEEVVEALTADFVKSLKPLGAHLHGGCEACSASSRPFCIALRESVELHPLLKSPRFLPMMFEMIDREGSSLDAPGPYRALGLDEVQARAVFRFQMSGCYAVALSDVSREDWQSVQRTVDAFVRGGLASLRAPACHSG